MSEKTNFQEMLDSEIQKQDEEERKMKENRAPLIDPVNKENIGKNKQTPEELQAKIDLLKKNRKDKRCKK